MPYSSRISPTDSFEEARKEEWRGEVHFGALLTGAARIHSALFRDELVRGNDNHGEPIVGGEMEGVGLLATCDPENSVWTVVKGISDFADEQRDQDVKEWRTTACFNSAKFVLQALRDWDFTG